MTEASIPANPDAFAEEQFVHELRVVIIDDDNSHAQLLQLSLEDTPGLQFTFIHYLDPDRALADLPTSGADLIFLDYKFPKHTGLEVLRSIRGRGDTRPIVVMTAHGDEYIAAEMTREGADDYLIKSDLSPGFVQQIVHRVLSLTQRNAQQRAERSGVVSQLATLTPRESEVLDLVISGYTNRQIAEHMHRSEKTVKIHRRNLMKKMDASTAGDLVRKAVMAGRGGNAALEEA